MTAAVAETNSESSLFTEHHCVAVHCTGCNEGYGDDWTIHFESLSEALEALRDAEWTVTTDEVLCPSCQPEDADPHTQIAVVEVCEFCWPPLIPSDEAPQFCTCESPGRTTLHTLSVPSITRAHPAFIYTNCVTLQCRDCDEDYGWAELPSHYLSRDEAIRAALSDDDPWTQDGNDLFCDRCTARRHCKENGGHTYPEQPHWTNPQDGTEVRYCNDCEEIQRTTPDAAAVSVGSSS